MFVPSELLNPGEGPSPGSCTESIPKFSGENSMTEEVAEQFCYLVFLVFARNSERWLRMGAGIAAGRNCSLPANHGQLPLGIALEFLLPGDVTVIFPQKCSLSSRKLVVKDSVFLQEPTFFPLCSKTAWIHFYSVRTGLL